jgi:hypothetical protein
MPDMFRDLYSDTQLQVDERRQDARTHLVIDIFFEGTDATAIANTRDISAGGLYMNTLASIPEGTTLRLRIPLGDEQIIVSARVIYSNPGHGVGVHFYNLSEKDRDAMERVSQEKRLAARAYA